MATDDSASSTRQEPPLVLDHIEIQDPDTIAYLTDQDVPPEEAARLALRTGVSALRVSETTEEAEFVRAEFEELQRDFEDEIEKLRTDLNDWFDEDNGDFQSIVDEHFGENGTIVQEVFDPAREGTPLRKLRTELEAELDSIRDSLLEEQTRDEVAQQTTLKGEDFEDDLEGLLGNTISSTDELARTGEEYGQLTDRFVGDFVLTLGESRQTIVIEAKDRTTISQPKIKEELTDGIENRNADYGILVLKNENAAPNKIGAFQEFDQQMLYVALSDTDSETYDHRLLELAVEWARMRTLSSQLDTDEEVDAETIHAKIDAVEDTLGQFQTVRKQCTNIKKARKNIEEELDVIQSGIEDDLETIKAELRE